MFQLPNLGRFLIRGTMSSPESSNGSRSRETTPFNGLDNSSDNMSSSHDMDDVNNSPEPRTTNSGDSTTPEIKILVQPTDKFRFRYKSEMMGAHGTLTGDKDAPGNKKEPPTVQVNNS